MKYLMVSLLISIFWAPSTWACSKASKKQISKFFRGTTKWTEVESKDSQYIATRNVIRLRVNFSNPTKTSVTMGGTSQGTVQQVCAQGRYTLTIVTSRGNIDIHRSGNGLKTHIMGRTFYYLPDNKVRQRTSEGPLLEPFEDEYSSPVSA